MTTSQHSKTNHTPGPWTVITTTTDGFYISGNRAADPVTEARHLFVAVVRPVPPPQPLWNEITWHEAKANARLIAAAPVLLTALRQAAAYLEYLTKGRATVEDASAVLTDLRQAITDATKGD